MINFSFVELAKIVMALILTFFPLSAKVANAHVSMLNAGDKVNGMMVTRGAADAQPLWLFCSSTTSKNVTIVNCRVPQITKLAIGHVFFGGDDVFKDTDWSDLTWKLLIDDQPVNLDDFGTYFYALPIVVPYVSLVKETLIKFTGWDVVLTNLQPGTHTIEGEVRSDTEQYKWMVNLVIENSSLSPEQFLVDKDSKDGQARCSQSIERLSRFCQSW